MKDGNAHNSKNIRHELYLKYGVSKPIPIFVQAITMEKLLHSVMIDLSNRSLPEGMTIQAKPATNRLPMVQKAAIKLSMDPRLDFG